MERDEALTLLSQVYASEPVYCYARAYGNTEQTTHDDSVIGAWLEQIRAAGIAEDLALRSAVLAQIESDADTEIARLQQVRGELDAALMNRDLEAAEYQRQLASVQADIDRQHAWKQHIESVTQGEPVWRP